MVRGNRETFLQPYVDRCRQEVRVPFFMKIAEAPRPLGIRSLFTGSNNFPKSAYADNTGERSSHCGPVEATQARSDGGYPGRLRGAFRGGKSAFCRLTHARYTAISSISSSMPLCRGLLKPTPQAEDATSPDDLLRVSNYPGN